MGLKEVIEAWKGVPIRELLRRMYIDEDMSQREIAKELHITQPIVSIWMNQYGITKNKDLFTLEKYYKHKKWRLKDDDEFKGRKNKSGAGIRSNGNVHSSAERSDQGTETED